jgi:HSP20 family protein
MAWSPWGEDSWSTFDELRRGMDDLLHRVLPAGGAVPAARAGAYPALNLYETPDGYVLTAELPGVAGDAIDVSVEGDRVTLRGERRSERPTEASIHRRERPTGEFRRALQLPVPIDADKVEATYRSGVLTLRLPKAAEHRPRQIRVRAA